MEKFREGALKCMYGGPGVTEKVIQKMQHLSHAEILFEKCFPYGSF